LSHMRAAILVEEGHLEVQEVPIGPPGPGEVNVQVKACTICATDIKWFKGIRPYPKPGRFGHEITGIVHELGEGVSGFAPGDRVLSRITRGGFAEYTICAGQDLVVLPDEIGYEEGAIAQLLPIAVNGARKSVRRGDTVFVSGVGPAGQLAAQVAKAYGASRVIASDLVDWKLALAVSLGADATINVAREDVLEALKRLCPQGVDVAMECVGSEASYRACERSVRGDGIVSIFGSILEPVVVDFMYWESHSLNVHAMREQPHQTPSLMVEAVALLASGAVKLGPLLTHVYPLDQVQEAFEFVIANRDDVLKIAVVP